VTARSDALHKTVMDYFPAELAERLHPVGRLDKDTCGLLILTSDGMLDQLIMQPERHITKTYFFYALGKMDAEKQSRLENGSAIPGMIPKQAKFTFGRAYHIRELKEFFPDERRERYMKNPDGAAFSGTLTVSEGKKHEVKRMLEAVMCRIFYLRRDCIGSLELDASLGPGEYRALTSDEVKMLYNSTGYDIL